MQQRQLRLGDILDDYCPRERRLTNHVIVAMIADDVKQTRCTTCETEHEFKHAKVPRQRRKSETPAALYAQVLANGPKRVAHDNDDDHGEHDADETSAAQAIVDEHPDETTQPIEAAPPAPAEQIATPADEDEDEDNRERDDDNGPIHRRLIRASLPRPEGQQPPARPIPEFTIRQPGGRPNRFRGPRQQRGPGGGNPQFQNGNRSNGNVHGGAPRGMRAGGGGRPPQNAIPQRGAPGGRRHGPGGRKRSK